MLNRIDANAKQSHSTPTDFVCSITVHLKQPADLDVAKKITMVPYRGKNQVNNIFIWIQFAIYDEGFEQTEVKLWFIVDMLINQWLKPLGLGKTNEWTVRVINLHIIQLFACDLGTKFSNLAVDIPNFEWTDLLLRAEIC